MKVKQIYSDFGIPNNLQRHMLRVASLATIILKYWKDSTINEQAIIDCAALHDIAKPVTFDIDKQRQFVQSEAEFEQVKHLITTLILKYGKDEHPAAIKIFQEVGCDDATLRLINELEWIYLPRLIDRHDIESLVLIYCDMRIGPRGILFLKERFEDLRNRAPFSGMDNVLLLTDNLECLVQKNTTIQLTSITDEMINTNFIALLDRNVG